MPASATVRHTSRVCIDCGAIFHWRYSNCDCAETYIACPQCGSMNYRKPRG